MVAWFRKLRSEDWFQRDPAVDLEQGRIYWPETAGTMYSWSWSADESRVLWRRDPAPRGSAVDDTYHFAPDPAAATGTFSPGPGQPGDVFDLTAQAPTLFPAVGIAEGAFPPRDGIHATGKP